MRALLLLLCATGLLVAGTPTREHGLTVHLQPEPLDMTKGAAGGFAVTSPANDQFDRTFGKPDDLLDYFHQQMPIVQQNGIWVVTTDPDAYAPIDLERLKSLIALCHKNHIPIFTCRAMDLPEGWAPAQ